MSKQFTRAIKVYALSALSGGILTYLTILVSVSLFAGFRNFLYEYSWADFYRNFTLFLLVYRLTGSHTFFALSFGALAGIWGYAASGTPSSPRAALFLYVVASSLIFNFQKIAITAGIPQRFANRPVEVIEELLNLNIMYTIAYFVAYWLSIPTVYYLHKRYAGYLQKLLEVR
ncbi:MAG: hypothetical protein ACUVV1_07600 [Fimbriimonadales bacterium]